MTTWAVAASLVLAGCGGVDGEAAVGTSDAAAADDEAGGASEVLTVACTDDGIDVGPRRVLVHPDGLHVDVRSLPDDGTSVELAGAPEGDGGGPGGSLGAAHEIGVSVIDTIAPGEVFVRCYPDRGPRHFQSAQEDPESLVIEVVDPDANSTPLPALDCSGAVAHTIYDHFTAPSDVGEPTRSLVDTAAADLGESREDIEIFGFRDGRRRWAGVRKGGSVVTIASYVADGDGWRLTTLQGCDGNQQAVFGSG